MKALRPQPRKTKQNPGQSIHEYVARFYHSIDKSFIPSEVEFQHVQAKSSTPNEKFKVLRDVQMDTYVDVMVQLVRQPYDTADRITLWVSDFTENDSFFHFAWKGPAIRADKPTDPNDYEYAMPYGAGSGGEWKGPFGKRSMQVTCFDQHATYIREQKLSMGSWVMLRNLHIKYGRNLANLEGFLRGQRNDSDLKINITQMDTTEESPDPRLKEAVRRKLDYEKEKQAQAQEIFNASWAGKKRKSNMAEMGITSSDKPKRSKNKNKRKKKSMGYEESVTSSAAVSTAVSTASSTNVNNPNGNPLRLSLLHLLSIFSVTLLPNKISQMRIRKQSHQHLRRHLGSCVPPNKSQRPGSRTISSLCKLKLSRGRASHQFHASRSQRFCSAKKVVGICDAL